MGTMPDTMQPAPLPSVYQLRVVVRGVSPLIWRRLLIPADTTIADLHAVLQVAIGWTGTHLHRFVVQGREYGIGYVGGPSFDADPRRGRRIQAVVATVGAKGPNSNCCIMSAGVFIPRVFRGRAFSSAATSIRRPELWADRSVPLGKYWRSSPLVFSLLPRCHGECGSQKKMDISEANVISLCLASSEPWSQVSDLRRCAGSVATVARRPSRTATAPCPAGRCTSIV